MKQSTEWSGHKLHLTEICDENLPRCITHVATTAATKINKCKYREICVRGTTDAGWPKVRHLNLRPQAEHEALVKASALMNDEDFWLRYRERH